MRKIDRILWLISAVWIASLLMGSTLTWVGDAGNGWQTGEAVTADDVNAIKTAVDGNATDIGTLNTQMLTALAYIGYFQGTPFPVPVADVACTDCIAMGAETAGNYVTSVATAAPITGGSAGSEGAQLTIALAADSIDATYLADVDFGDFTCSDAGGGCLIDANAVALGTDTTGNYVETIADSGAGEVTVSGSGSEAATVTLAIASSITRDSELSSLTLSASDASGNCTTKDMWIRTAATTGIWACTATNTWTKVANGP